MDSPPVRTVPPSKGSLRFGTVLRVVLADDHPLLRESMRLLLESRAEVQIVGEASDGSEAVEHAIRLKPDMVLMDIDMPNLNGIEAAAQVRRHAPEVQVIMLSNYAGRNLVRDAIRAGASGFVVKHSDVDELMLAMMTVHRKNVYFSASLMESLGVEEIIREAKSMSSTPREALSIRERQIVQLFAEGHTARSIADHLCLSEKTVEAHRAHIMVKLGARTRMDLLKFALMTGIATLDSPRLGAA